MSEDNANNDSTSSSFTVDDTVPLHHLTPNQFYKICPTRSTALGKPICGDGSPFCFYVSRPPQRFESRSKVTVELIGGGACWSAQTCARQSDYLYVNSDFDNLLGRSCSEAQYGGGNNNNNNGAFNFLCATQLDTTADLRQYTTIYVPYCTQDVHTGSNVAVYAENDDDDDDGSNTLTVYHTGAHNILSVVRYIQRNFRTLESMFLTGCSAGGTGLPALFRLLDQRYGHTTTRINAITDSPVYLTPAYFLETALPEWNPSVMLRYLGIPYRRFRENTAYSTVIWDYILQRSSKHNQWGFLSHTDDPVSQTYFAWMSGGNADGGGRRRRVEEDQQQEEWYQELTSSIQTIQSKHSNVDVFWVDGEGHCTLGLYYGLQQDGFTEWASNIIRDVDGVRHKGRAMFRLGGPMLLSGMLALLLHRRRKRIRRRGDDSLLQTSKEEKGGWQQRLSVWTFALQQRWDTVASWLEPFPLTATYMCVVTIYFWTMVLDQGLVHPLNNLALGPSAAGLSRYGILNPTMVLQRWQWYRWISSTMLCSGIVTYGIVMANLWWRVRPLEMRWGDSRLTGGCWAAIVVVVQTVYCVAGMGASSSCLPIVLGLAACSVQTICAGIQLFWEAALVSLLFPFNSWIMILTSLCCGSGFQLISSRSHSESDGESRVAIALSSGQGRIAVATTAILIPLLLFFAGRSDSLYLEPYYTGCTVYWSDQIGDFSNFAGGDGRRLEQQDNLENACAQVCIPHLASPFVGLVTGSRLQRGQCADGYYHALDKTFKYMTYSLDVEILFADNNDGGDE